MHPRALSSPLPALPVPSPSHCAAFASSSAARLPQATDPPPSVAQCSSTRHAPMCRQSRHRSPLPRPLGCRAADERRHHAVRSRHFRLRSLPSGTHLSGCSRVSIHAPRTPSWHQSQVRHPPPAAPSFHRHTPTRGAPEDRVGAFFHRPAVGAPGPEVPEQAPAGSSRVSIPPSRALRQGSRARSAGHEGHTRIHPAGACHGTSVPGPRRMLCCASRSGSTPYPHPISTPTQGLKIVV